jgi:hypothetical protein
LDIRYKWIQNPMHLGRGKHTHCREHATQYIRAANQLLGSSYDISRISLLVGSPCSNDRTSECFKFDQLLQSSFQKIWVWHNAVDSTADRTHRNTDKQVNLYVIFHKRPDRANMGKTPCCTATEAQRYSTCHFNALL